MTVYVNGLSTDTVSYGGMYIADNANATTISASDTWYEVGNFVEGSNEGITYSSNALTVTVAGKYQLVWSASTSAETPNDIFDIGISINDNAPLNNTIIERKYSSSDVGASSGNSIVVLNAGDVIKLEVKNVGGTGNITFKWANVVLHKL